MRSSHGHTDSAGKRGRATSRWRPARLALVATAAAVVLAGCGGAKRPSVASVATTTSTGAAASTNAAGGTAGSGSQSQPQQAGLKYARCMRANGVPNFPDPSGSGGFTFSPGTGVDPSSPAFEAAQAKCQKYMNLGGGLATGTQTHPSPQWLAKMVKAAQCMRRHGVPNFPDPTTTVPSPRVLGGSGQISNIEGAIFVFPGSIDTQSPQFTRAAKACGFPVHNH
jgi:hypothetical protein